ncbi:MAG: sigma-70 family RNA polymerase sigma factor [Eubacterium sp.]|nr:sigma-70 family RNA polymerase sigma factor [Eubacterium sp.]
MNNDEFIYAVKRNSNRLYLIALTFTKNHYDAEDIVQNTFLKLMKQNKTFESEKHMDNWLTAVCINESKDYLKSFFRKNSTSLEDAKELYTFDKPKDFDLFTAVMSLPKKERTVIHLFYYEDLSIKEIAVVMKISESSVGTRLHRARKHLKEILGDEWINE